MKKIILILSIITVSSCASKSLTPESKIILDEIKSDYNKCITDTMNKASLSYNTKIAVSQIVSFCDPHLINARHELESAGFSKPFIDGYTYGLHHGTAEKFNQKILYHNVRRKKMTQ